MRDLRTWLLSLSDDDREDNLKTLCVRYANTGNVTKLFALLTNFDFLDIKISEFGLQEVTADYNRLSHPHIVKSPAYDLAEVATLQSIQQALKQSSSLLQADPQQLSSHLWGRLSAERSLGIQKLLQGVIDSKAKSDQPTWLRPLEVNLSPPGGPLEATLTGHKSKVTALAVSSDSNTLIAGSDRQITIWNIATLTSDTLDISWFKTKWRQFDMLLFKYDTEFTFSNRVVKALVITDDDSLCISGSSDGVLRVWDLNSKELLRVQEILCEQFADLDYVHIEERIKSTLSAGEKINLYNAINSLALIHGTNSVAVGCEDGAIYFYNIETGELSAPTYRHCKPICKIVASLDGQLVIASSEDAINMLDRLKGKITLFRGPSPPVKLLSLSSIGSDIGSDLILFQNKTKLAATRAGNVFVWDLIRNQCLFTLDINVLPYLTSIAVTHDCQKLILGEHRGDIVIRDLSKCVSQQALVLWQLKNRVLSWVKRTFSCLRCFDRIKADNFQFGKKVAILVGHTSAINALVVTPNGKYLVSAADDVKLWRLNRLWQSSLPLDQYYRGISHIAVSADGRYLVSDGGGSGINIWDLPSRKILLRDVGIHKSGSLLITPDSQRIIAPSYDGIRFYDVKTGQREHTVKVPKGSIVETLAISRDAKYLISAVHQVTGQPKNSFLIWDMSASKVRKIREITDDAEDTSGVFVNVTISSNNKRILSLKRGKQLIKVWNFETGEVLNTFICDYFSIFILTPNERFILITRLRSLVVIDLLTGQNQVEIPQLNEVTQLAAAPHSRWFVSINKANTVQVWELATGNLLATFRSESNQLKCCAVAPDNSTIIVGDASGQLHFFRLEGVADDLPTLHELRTMDYWDKIKIDVQSSILASPSKPDGEMSGVDSPSSEITVSEESDSYTIEAVFSSPDQQSKVAPYQVQLTGLPGGTVHLAVQVRGTGILVLKIYSNHHPYFVDQWTYEEDKTQPLNVIKIPLPSNVWGSNLVGDLLLNPKSEESLLSAPHVKINIYCPVNPDNQEHFIRLKTLEQNYLTLYQRLELQKQLLGNHHPDVASTLFALSQRCEKIKSYAEAEFFKQQEEKIRDSRQKIEVGNTASAIILFLTPDEIILSA